MDILYIICYCFLLLFVLFYPPTIMYKNTFQGIYNKKLMDGYKIRRFVPFIRHLDIKRMFYDKCPIETGASAFLIAAILFRVSVLFIFYSSVDMHIISSFIIFVALIAYAATMIVMYFRIACLLGEGILCRVMCFVLLPVAIVIIGGNVNGLLHSKKVLAE